MSRNFPAANAGATEILLCKRLNFQDANSPTLSSSEGDFLPRASPLNTARRVRQNFLKVESLSLTPVITSRTGPSPSGSRGALEFRIFDGVATTISGIIHPFHLLWLTLSFRRICVPIKGLRFTTAAIPCPISARASGPSQRQNRSPRAGGRGHFAVSLYHPSMRLTG